MMDCLHFLFEEDFTSVTEEHAKSRSAIRETLYRDMYGVGYAFRFIDPKNKRGTRGVVTSADGVDYTEFETLDAVKPVDARKSDPFSSRNESKKKKIEFVDASEFTAVEQSFTGIDAPLN